MNDRLVKGTFNAPTASEYEAEIRRAEEQVLVDRLTWLADAASLPQARAIASVKLAAVAQRGMPVAGTMTFADQAHKEVLAANIKRFLERPADVARLMPAPDAPPGAPIGDVGMEWLSPPPLCGWSATHPDRW